jgi:hypothetical protein
LLTKHRHSTQTLFSGVGPINECKRLITTVSLHLNGQAHRMTQK